MKNQLKYIFPLLSILFIAGSCKKDLLPSASQKGANTFGCKINGADLFRMMFIPIRLILEYSLLIMIVQKNLKSLLLN